MAKIKAKDRRRLEREAEQIRKESALPQPDIRRLMADPLFNRAMMETAEKAEPDQKRGKSG